MNSTPTIRPRHALRWVLSVGLVFVVVVGMGLRMARRQADGRWYSLVSHWNEEWDHSGVLQRIGPQLAVFHPGSGMNPEGFVVVARQGKIFSDTSGHNMFRGWRQATRGGGGMCTLVLRQERSFFGSSIEARMSGCTSMQVESARAVLAELGIEVVVVP